MALVNIHPSLVRFTDNQTTLELIVESTAHVLSMLCKQYPTLAARIVNSQGELTPYVNIYVNGKNISQFSTPKAIQEGDTIDLVTSLVGG